VVAAPGPALCRVVVLVAFAATLCFAGPRALAVLARRSAVSAAAGPRVELGRAAVLETPEWLRGPLLASVLRTVEPELRGAIALTDEAQALELGRRLEQRPFVERATVARRYPDRFVLELRVRRPVATLCDADGAPQALVDADGRALPLPAGEIELPRILLRPALRLERLAAGEVVGDPRVLRAVKVVVEWRDRIVPEVAAAPRLCAVDASNLGHAFVADPETSEILVVLAGGTGEEVVFHYGRAGDDGGAVPAATKAWVLGRVLAAYPGLGGLAGGDLRLRNRWADCLLRRGGAVADARVR
jgi:hypothetical protein